MITFRKVREPYGWLSNMSPHPVGFDFYGTRVLYRTAEHMFQALRFSALTATGIAIRQEIMDQKSPMAAKMVAKKHSQHWEIMPRTVQDLMNMRMTILCKLYAHQDLRKQLLETGDHELVEDVTARPNESGLYWGKALQHGVWSGNNQLGKIWMEVREQFKKHPDLW